MSHRERRHLRIDELPGNLSEALDELEKDDLVRDTLGDHLFEHFVAAKREEWLDYIKARLAVGDRIGIWGCTGPDQRKDDQGHGDWRIWWRL